MRYFPKSFQCFLLSYRRKKVSNALLIESQVLDILRSYPNSELLSCKLADDIATTLLAATPDSYEVAAKIPDYCRPQDVAMINVALEDLVGYFYHHPDRIPLDRSELTNRHISLMKVFRRHPKYAEYAADLGSFTGEEAAELTMGYLMLPTSHHRLQYVADNSTRLFSSNMDYYLAAVAHAAHLDKDEEVEDEHMRFRRVLMCLKESDQGS